MSIASEITRIKGNIETAYTELSEKGAVMPDVQNSENLGMTISSIQNTAGTVAIHAKNLLNLDTLETGKSLNWSTGAISENANRCITDYIPVTVGKYLVSSYYIRKVLKPYTLNAVCFYDENKKYLSGVGSVSSVVISSGTAYIRACGNTYMPQESFKAQLELSDTVYPTFFEPYREDAQGLADSIITANSILTRYNAGNSFRLALPRKLYCTAGETLRVYHRNILSHPKYMIAFYTADKMVSSDTVSVTVLNYDDYAEFVAGGSGGVYIPYAVYDDNFNLIAYDNIEVYVTDTEAPSASVLLIGDSTVAQDNTLATQLQALYGETSSTLTLLGTRGDTGKNHEGRAGWKAEEYLTVASKGGITNAFWDGEKFDFSYYMTQQGYSSVDAVFIQLGVNDLISTAVEDCSPEEVAGYIDVMVKSIKQYSSDTKIIVNLLIPPNSDGSTFAEKYHGTQAEWLYRYNTIKLNQYLTDYYRDDDRVTVLGINIPLDTNVDIWDGIHPTTAGHRKIARTIYAYLANETEV